MTNYAQHLNKPASPGQQQLLRRLAIQRGVSFIPPRSSAQASEQIDALLAGEVPPPEDIDRDLQAVREDLASGPGALAPIHPDEIGGHGSTAHWR
jgi:hypothetical protein